MRETTLNAMGIKVCCDLRNRAHDLIIAFTPHEYHFLITLYFIKDSKYGKCGMGLGQTKHGEEGYEDSF